MRLLVHERVLLLQPARPADDTRREQLADADRQDPTQSGLRSELEERTRRPGLGSSPFDEPSPGPYLPRERRIRPGSGCYPASDHISPHFGKWARGAHFL